MNPLNEPSANSPEYRLWNLSVELANAEAEKKLSNSMLMENIKRLKAEIKALIADALEAEQRASASGT